MRFIFTIGLTLFYLTASCGVSINLHYCHGKLNKIEWFSHNSKADCCKGKAMKRNCCKNHKIALEKLSKDILSKTIAVAPAFSQPINISYPHLSIVDKYFRYSFITVNEHSPPLRKAAPIYILDRSFRI